MLDYTLYTRVLPVPNVFLFLLTSLSRLMRVFQDTQPHFYRTLTDIHTRTEVTESERYSGK